MELLQGFNPLAGIRCFLTDFVKFSHTKKLYNSFQSPSGDSLFSDVEAVYLFDTERNVVSIP